jgi:YHS domain-containing protein
MYVTMVMAALLVAGAFALLGLSPSGPRPDRADIFGSVQINYKLALNVLGAAVFAALWWLTRRRGVTDPVCGMRVDREKAVTRSSGSRTVYFCSDVCAEKWAQAAVNASPGTASGPG